VDELTTLLTVEEFPPEPTADASEVYLVRNVGLRDGTHKFHRFPGKFIPHVPRWALRRYGRADGSVTVLDPFCGSGTTLVETALAGYSGYGFDIDPIARLITKVKTTSLDLAVLSNCCREIQTFITQRRAGKFKPTIPTLAHWFNEAAIRDLSLIREGVEQFRAEKDVYDFLLTVFIAVIRRASNADNQTQKTYVSHTNPKTPESAKPLFLATLNDYTQRLVDFGNLQKLMGGHARVLGAWDARGFVGEWQENRLPKVDLAISSPPYVKSVDYVYNQMAEYFWVGDLFGLSTQKEQNRHKQVYVGTQQLNGADVSRPVTAVSVQAEELFARIRKKDRKNAYICATYFRDMQVHFEEMAKILKPGSHYVLVVGDSVVSGEIVATHSLLPACGAVSGFALERVFRYEIRNRHMRFPRAGRGGIVEHDWILDFRLK
jgi:SAM-dependent methyltransferase